MADHYQQIASEVTRMEEMRRRLGFTGDEGKNIIGAMLTQRLRDADTQSAKNAATIVLVDKAIEHVQLYGWELDPAPSFSGDIFRMYAEAAATDLRRTTVMDFASLHREPLRGRTFRIHPMAPAANIKLAPLSSKAPKHRKAFMSNGGLYRRLNTCTLDDEGKQVPRPRGSWREMERRAAETRAVA